MSLVTADFPYKVFYDTDRTPLENGYIWIGESGKDPETNAIFAYSDSERTRVLSQPIRTQAGLPVDNNGSPVKIYPANDRWSITVKNKNSVRVHTVLTNGETATAANITYTPLGVGAIDTDVQTMLRYTISVVNYGAVADRDTDCLAGFNTALTVAKAYGKALFIPPPLKPGYFYRLSDVWTIADADFVCIYGVGPVSLLCIDNNAGANAITLDTTRKGLFRNFGICGVTGSGNGIELTDLSHYNVFDGVFVSKVDGDGFVNTSGISTRVINCSWDENIGVQPFDYTGTSLVAGKMRSGVVVPSHPTGQNNNFKWVNCHVNAVGDTGAWSVIVGDGTDAIDNFQMEGGLIQGGDSYQCLKMNLVRDSYVDKTYIEPPVGATSNYVVELDDCLNVEIEAGALAGDVKLTGANDLIEIAGARMGGINADSTNKRVKFKRGSYANSSSGPTSGAILDASGKIEYEEFYNAAGSDRFDAVLNFSKDAALYISENFEIWDNESSPSRPSHVKATGSPTLTKVSSPVFSGDHACRVVSGAGVQTDGITLNLPEPDYYIGRRVNVSCRAYVATGGKRAYLKGNWNSGAIVNSIPTQFTGQYEQLSGTFYAQPGDTSFVVSIVLDDFTSATIDELKIWVDGYKHVTYKEVASAATIDVSVHNGESGYAAKTVNVTGTTNITQIDGMIPGEPVLFKFEDILTITDGGNFDLAGNLTTSAGDCVWLVKDPTDGIIRQCAPESVN